MSWRRRSSVISRMMNRGIGLALIAVLWLAPRAAHRLLRLFLTSVSGRVRAVHFFRVRTVARPRRSDGRRRGSSRAAGGVMRSALVRRLGQGKKRGVVKKATGLIPPWPDIDPDKWWPFPRWPFPNVKGVATVVVILYVATRD